MANMVFCRGCGKQIHESAPTCPQCGAVQVVAGSAKSRTTAGVLAILLGGFGAHKFYMGRVGMGLFYLLFCWTIIPFVAGLIEGIIYLSESDAAFSKRCK